jgi:hypothetical protein
MKVAQLRAMLEGFANLYERSNGQNQAKALRALSAALAKADRQTVEEVMSALETSGRAPMSKAKSNFSH